MNTSDENSHQSNKETQAFDPPLIHEKIVEHPDPDAEKESAEELEPAEVEENRDETQVATKEAMLRVSRGQL
jgi:hypothetical protein